MAVTSHTIGKNPFTISPSPLADAIAQEWQGKEKYDKAAMPLTSIAFTAIDRIQGNEEAISEALLVYVDTDTLSYRADDEDKLLFVRQQERWDPILAWIQNRFDVTVQTVSGIMPIDQPLEVHRALGNYLQALDASRLSAACILASGYSSLILMIAVVEGRITADQGFKIARLEEEMQAERWGEDEEMAAGALRLQQDIRAAGRFLRLLDEK